MADDESMNADDSTDDWADAMAEQASADEGKIKETDNYQSMPLNNLSEDRAAASGKEMNLDMILDVPVTISMEIGRSKISIRNLLQLTQGSVVELDRLAGEPLDVLINGTLIAHGEVVVVNEKFGIRLTDVISAAERVKRLK